MRKEAKVKITKPESTPVVIPSSVPTRLRLPHIMAISIFWFALNFHWNAILSVILPSQVFKMVGDLNKYEALSFVLIPGAFISLIANPLFGWLSDHMRGPLAAWGRRRPYIFFGTLVNIGGLIGMAVAHDIPSLAIAYAVTQFSSNAAQAAFHALLPDIVPQEQRGSVSGIMGMLMIAGSIVGVVLSGIFVNSSQPIAIYQQSIWMIYGIIIAVIFIFMIITIVTARERPVPREEIGGEKRPRKLFSKIPKSLITTIEGTLVAVLLLWLLMFAWNRLHLFSFSIDSSGQQIVLEIIVTFGILRIFDFRPRRDPDFAWVLVTRFLMMMGVSIFQNIVQYYLHDVVHLAHPELATSQFLAVAAVASLPSALVAGWLSDRLGRKRLVYFSGGIMGVVGLSIIIVQLITQSPAVILPMIYIVGFLFGLGFGAYQSVDWALVADVLPSQDSFAKDMGVWNISLSLPQVISPVIPALLLTFFSQRALLSTGYELVFAIGALFCLLSTVGVRYIRYQASVNHR